jgi:hypothetical protein
MKSEEEHDKFLKQLKAIPNTLQIHQSIRSTFTMSGFMEIPACTFKPHFENLR